MITLGEIKKLIHELMNQQFNESEVDEGHEGPSHLSQMNREGDGYLYDIFGNPVENDDLNETKKKFNTAYLRGSQQKIKRKKEIERRAKESHKNPRSYRPFTTDKDPKTGETIKTKPSKWNKKFEKMFGSKKKEKNESMEHETEIFEDVLLEEIDLDLEVLKEFICEAILDEKKKGANVTQALKNKAEKANAPMGALRAIYNKGLAAWRTGHRPGASQHAWAMARVNSVLAGGPARKVDAAQWERIRKHRGKKKKRK